jgi:hypothetical protein
MRIMIGVIGLLLSVAIFVSLGHTTYEKVLLYDFIMTSLTNLLVD